MKKYSLAVVLFFVLTVFSGNAFGGTAKITGYAPGERSITPSVRSSFEESVAKIRKEEKEIKKNKYWLFSYELIITLMGKSDKTGPDILNDDVRIERARGIESVMKERFPYATVSSHGEKDDGDERCVEISWKLIGKTNYILLALIVIPIVLMLFLIVLTRTLLGKGNEQNQKVKILRITLGEYVYSIRYEFKGGKFHSPYKSSNGNDVMREDFKKFKRSVKECLVKEEFVKQTEKLIKKGIIEKKEVKRNES